MKKILESLFHNLMTTSNLNVSAFVNTTNETSFIFRHAKFFLMQEILLREHDEIGVITVYNYTSQPLNGTHFKEIKHFELKVFSDETIKIKNHENYSNSLRTPRVDDFGYIICEPDKLPVEFFKQLETLLIKQQIALAVYRGEVK
jgi:hypothetical protein